MFVVKGIATDVPTKSLVCSEGDFLPSIRLNGDRGGGDIYDRSGSAPRLRAVW